jgi:hypothetical protein
MKSLPLAYNKDLQEENRPKRRLTLVKVLFERNRHKVEKKASILPQKGTGKAHDPTET